jgi:cell division protein FtsI (penicillin-binding protein 3)
VRKIENPYKYRIRICFIVFLFLFSSLFVRAFYLQVIPNARIKKMKEIQEVGTFSLSSPRGTIYDRNGRALAISIELPSVFVDPSITTITKDQIKKIAAILKMSPDILKQKIKNKDKKFVWIKRKIQKDRGEKIKQMSIYGIGVVNEWDRFYPDREMGSQIIGVVGTDSEGLEGIEKYYDDFLFSTPTVTKMAKDAKGRVINVGSKLSKQGKEGVDVYLTIDSTIQYLLERELVSSAVHNDVKQAMGVIWDPNNGEILAMSSYPQSNPNRIERGDDVQSLRNLNVLDVFEPGSTMKIFIMAGALEDSVVKTTDIFDCREGSLKIGSKEIVNPIKKEWLDPKGILKYSNNVGIARIGMKMGKNRVIKTLEKFGFGSKTGIDFPGEGPGMFQKEAKWHDMRLANISYGQGMAVTPIQLVRALSIIANGGYSIQPYLVQKIDMGLNEQVNYKKDSVLKHPVFSKKTIDQIRSWMEAVTETDGSGFRAKVPGYRVAGKTGTAQIYDQETKEYSHDELVASFMGFAPASNPKVAGIIIYRQPENMKYGGEIAAPVFRKVMEQSMRYLDIPQDEKKKPEAPVVAKKEKTKPFVPSEDEAPDFLNLSVREAVTMSQKYSLDMEYSGTGVVYKQEPEKGEKLQNKKVKLFLKSPETKTKT